MYKIVQKTKYLTTLSIIAVVLSIGVWIGSWVYQEQHGVHHQYGFQLGIDFTGGSQIEMQFADASKRPSADDAKLRIEKAGAQASQIQTAGNDALVIKTAFLDNDTRAKIIAQFADVQGTERSFTSVGPTLGAELLNKAFLALGLVMLGILAYITYAFRHINNGPVPSWAFGAGAIVALIHDVILVLGVYIVLGFTLGVQIDTLFVTALLTVLGFSVHDTIVVYDRIREGLKQQKKYTFADIVNRSINTTMARSLNTSITTLFVLSALYLFGGATIQYFVLALIIGIIIGTYSSIFVASPVLIIVDKMRNKEHHARVAAK